MRWLLAGLAALVVTLAAIGRRRFLVVTVAGDSMRPALRPGDRLLVRRTRRVRAGQVAVLRPPPAGLFMASAGPSGLLVKRIVAVPGDRVPESCRIFGQLPECVPPGSFIMLGDNSRRSYDSRFAGLIPADLLIGVAVRPVAPVGPVGPVAPVGPVRTGGRGRVPRGSSRLASRRRSAGDYRRS